MYGIPYFLNIKEDEPLDCVNKACIVTHVDWDGSMGFMSPDNIAFVEVQPETVGQFTEKLDSEGNEVYNGDILEDVFEGIPDRFVVKWYGFGFVVFDVKNDRYAGSPNYMQGNLKIIGNIHENPELI